MDDAGIVSHAHTKKGITANWDSDAPGIAWCDYRDGSPDYDTYFDHELNPYITQGGAPDMGADEHYRHTYVYGNLVAGGNITLNIMGPPSVSGCAYFFSPNQLTTPYPGTWWDWMIGNPMTALGAKSLSGTIPASPVYPYTIYLQSIVGPPYEFTNCAEIHIN